MNTLKRLSWNSSTDPAQPNLLPPGTRSPGYAHTPSPQHSPVASPSSPAYPFPTVPAAVTRPQVERQTLHRSLSAVSSLLVALDAFREVSLAQAKALKNVAKAERELAMCFGDKVEPGARNDVIGELSSCSDCRRSELISPSRARPSVIASALQASSAMFETLAEVDSKHAKVVKKEYESLNELAGKWFTKTSVRLSQALNHLQLEADHLTPSVTERGEDFRRVPRSARPQGAEGDRQLRKDSAASAEAYDV